MTKKDRLWGRWVHASDLNALGQLFDGTAPELRRLALFLARDAESADDAVQSTFLAALERPRDLGTDGRVEAWLAGILVRQVRRQHSERARNRGVDAGEEVLAAASAHGPSPVHQLSGKELESRIAALIDGLPRSFAVPLRRQLLDGESAPAIAEELGLSTGAVHARVSRGLKRLRKLMPAGFGAPALGQGSQGPPQPALAELRSRFLETAASGHPGTSLSAHSAAAALPSALPSALILACVAAVAAVGAGFALLGSQGESSTAEQALAPGSLAGAGDTGPSSLVAAALGSGERVALRPGSPSPPSTGTPATDPGADAPGLDPAPGPEVDLAALTTPHALFIDENSNRPLSHAVCRVTDANGVTVIAETDSEGRFLTDELLLTGRVSASVMGPAEKQNLRLLERPGRPRIYDFDGPDHLAISRHVKVSLRHSGDPNAPDRWRTSEKRWVPLACAGVAPEGSSVELVLASGGPEPTHELRWPQPPGMEGLDQDLVLVTAGERPLVFEAMQARELRRRPDATPLPPWSRQRVGSPEAGRVVRGVQFLESGVLVAEADASVVPYLHEAPLRLEFALLMDPDAREMLALYGKDLGRRILRHCLPGEPEGELPPAVIGFVTSESGGYHGPVNVGVTNMMLQIWRRGVTWKQEDGGDWVGTFEFTDLAEGPHDFTLSAGPSYPVHPPRAEASAPHVFERGHFVVQDLKDGVSGR